MAKTSSKRPWILVLLMVAAVVLYFQVPKNDVQEVNKPYTIEKTGAGVVVDFTATSRKIHSAVDGGLSKTGLTAQDVKESSREQPRQGVEGVIRWHSRQIMVNIPADASLEGIEQTLAGQVRNAGGEILASQPDNYEGLPVVRLDIGVRDTLAGDPLTIIADRLYITKEKAAGTAKKSKTSGPVRGELAIIIDDFGYTREPIGAFAAIERPLTFAVLPYRPYSNEAAARGVSSGHQVMLHLPLEPLTTAEQSEETTITVTMSDEEIKSRTARAINSIPGLIGVNNHQGSRATADHRVMRLVLGVVKANNLFFVDSRTNSLSVAGEVARQMSVHTTDNELFIDNSNEVSAVKKQLHAAGEMAARYGSATIIGHARLSTATAVQEMIPELEASGIKLVFVSQIVR